LAFGANAQTGTSGDLDVISVGGKITLRRVSYYSEPMPDTTYISNRRDALVRERLRIDAEFRLLDTLKSQWETEKGKGSSFVQTQPVPKKEEPVPTLTFSQGRGDGLWHFTAFDRLGRNLLLVQLRDDGTIWVNGEQWVYSKTRKRYQLKRK